MKQEVTLIATAAMGIESVVGNEVRKLGYEPKIDNGKVTFKGPLSAIARSNLWLRAADRIKLLVGEFEATTFDDLFEQTKNLPWEQFIPEDGEVPVIGRSVKSKLHSVPDCQAIVKRAIVDRLTVHHGLASRLPETGDLYRVEVAILKDKVTLTIDTSGSGLHRRGYRVEQGEAPLQETLAATLILLTNWTPDEPFIDPFCGSGTIPIEAALIGQNIAPGFNREFASENWGFIPDDVWDLALEEAEDLANYDQSLEIIGSDIDHKMVDISKNNALEAGLSDLIEWKQMQVADLAITKEIGYLVSNPPYGERIGKDKEVTQIYKTLGNIMRKHPKWSVYVLTANRYFERHYGKDATRKRKLFNGYIRTDFYQYFGKR